MRTVEASRRIRATQLSFDAPTVLVLSVAAAVGTGCGGKESTAPPVPAAIASVSGDKQTGTVGQALPQPLVVRVTDKSGTAVSGVAVLWAATAGGGGLAASSTVTDPQGQASVIWTLGTTVGTNTAAATVSGLVGSPVTFTANGAAASPSAAQSLVTAAPTTITASNSTSQATITVTVKDAFGNPVNGATVTLAATGTANALTQPVSATNPAGQVTGTLSSTKAEAKTITAKVNGTVTVSEVATVTVAPAPAMQLAFAVQPTTAMTGTAIAPAVQVTASDGYGNIATSFVGNVSIAIGTNPGGGTLSGTPTVAATAGVATFRDLSIDKGGTGYTLAASASGLIGATSNPFQVIAPYSISLSAGISHTCGVASGAVAYCWGDNSSGQLGTTTSNCAGSPCSFVPVAVQGGLSFASVSSGDYYTCGVTADGRAYCWGNNGAGQLGIGSASNLNYVSPVPVSGGLRFLMVGTSDRNYVTCGLTSSGAAFCWGDNGYGELGTGGTSSSTVPVAVAGNLAFVRITVGAVHACGLTASGAAYCWGGGNALGNGTTTNSSTPVPVAGGLTFTVISAGTNHTCGVTTGGTAYCWGDNTYGQLGSTTASSTVPVLVTGGLTFVSIGAGDEHTCGIVSGGAASCWGNNAYGQLGNGSTLSSASPTLVSGSVQFKLITTGGTSTCGVAVSATAYCWGSNYSGQLGIGGSAMTYSTPQVVSGLSFP